MADRLSLCDTAFFLGLILPNTLEIYDQLIQMSLDPAECIGYIGVQMCKGLLRMAAA